MHTCPYRDWLTTLGRVVLVLQGSVLSHRGINRVPLLKTENKSDNSANKTAVDIVVVVVVISDVCWRRLTPLLALLTLLVFLGGGGLYLGGPLQHKHTQPLSESQQIDDTCCVTFYPTHNKHLSVKTTTTRHPNAETHSPRCFLLRCFWYMAMAVPMMASRRMTPMMAPMMVPVVGPFPGRRVTAGRRQERKRMKSKTWTWITCWAERSSWGQIEPHWLCIGLTQWFLTRLPCLPSG